MKTMTAVFVVLPVMFFATCTTFIKKNDIQSIKEYENREYILKDDNGEGNLLIKKGEKVKVYIVTGDDFIKVYCYPFNKDFLKTERTLIVYLFEDDFNKSKFDLTLFEEKFFSKIEIPKMNEEKKGNK